MLRKLFFLLDAKLRKRNDPAPATDAIIRLMKGEDDAQHVARTWLPGGDNLKP